MKIAVFGGTGKTGQHVIQQALDAAYQINILVRTATKLTQPHQNLSVVQGDVLDFDSVATVIQDVDAVISVLGPTENKPTFTISRGMENILQAMKEHNVARLIISTGAGVHDPNDKPKFLDRLIRLLLKVISKHVLADMEQVVEKVKASDRDWTIVRVPMLTDQPPQDSLLVGYVGDINPRITRADMAAFMLKQLHDDSYLHQSPAISN